MLIKIPISYKGLSQKLSFCTIGPGWKSAKYTHFNFNFCVYAQRNFVSFRRYRSIEEVVAVLSFFCKGVADNMEKIKVSELDENHFYIQRFT